jgi:hypothetical protein
MANTEHTVLVVTTYGADVEHKFIHSRKYGPPILSRGNDGELIIKRKVEVTYNSSVEFVVAIYQADSWMAVTQEVQE